MTRSKNSAAQGIKLLNNIREMRLMRTLRTQALWGFTRDLSNEHSLHFTGQSDDQHCKIEFTKASGLGFQYYTIQTYTPLSEHFTTITAHAKRNTRDIKEAMPFEGEQSAFPDTAHAIAMIFGTHFPEKHSEIDSFTQDYIKEVKNPYLIIRPVFGA